ncbi:Uncharacterized protein y4mH [Durusdinium trenchii]|uniref:Uncharacterized protein y4mH n=1 Tax=Durusdinium trenchii TaxID=1381693 RepID=A0ABP0HZ89_9DINO
MSSALADWLDGVPEEAVLDPDLPIVDAHHHLWPAATRQLTELHIESYGNNTTLNEQYLGAEFRADWGKHNVIASVYVECGSFYDGGDTPRHLRSVGETRAVEALAADNKIAGILADVDLTLPRAQLEEALDAHAAASPTRFKGVRSKATSDEDHGILSHALPRNGRHGIPRDFCNSPDFRRGAKVLADRGLVLDVYLFFHQIPFLAELARSTPSLTIVLDHCGAPLGIRAYKDQKEQVAKDWSKAVRELATCPNVCVKLGGLGMPLTGITVTDQSSRPHNSEELADALFPWYKTLLDAFGPDRCILESNFPMDKVTSSYHTLWNANKRIADRAKLSPQDKSKIFSGTATRVYQLGASSKM